MNDLERHVRCQVGGKSTKFYWLIKEVPNQLSIIGFLTFIDYQQVLLLTAYLLGFIILFDQKLLYQDGFSLFPQSLTPLLGRW